MRHSQNRRSRSRSRKGPNPLTRSYESNGPDVKVRGTAAHVAEKYMSLARDAQSSGDSVAAENYLQHAEHYIRIVMAAQAQFQQAQQPSFRENYDEGDDDDRQMNGRGRDRFDSNGQDGRAPDDDAESFDGDDEDDRFGPVPQLRTDERQGYRNGDRQQYRPDDRHRPRDDRGPRHEDRGYRGEDRGPRNDDRGPRDERGGRDDRSSRDHDMRGPRPPRYERRDRYEPGEGARDEQRLAGAGDGGQATAPEPAETPAAPAAASEDSAGPTRRRRTRPRVVNGSEAAPDAPDATPDGAAALAAFPE